MYNENILPSGGMNFVAETSPIINNYGKTVLERFDAPLSYNRSAVEAESFAAYLRTLPLKPDGSPVYFYNGTIKESEGVYVAVVDMPVSRKNVQMSAHAVMRLISEYLYNQKNYEKIAFHDGKEKIDFNQFGHQDHSRKEFDHYLDYVMERVSTPSFCADMKSVKLSDIKIGDIFIQNSLPYGHAVIVVDMVQNNRGEKLLLLAQGFQPAQEIQILTNPNQEDISPWYRLEEGELLTPEWRFMTSDLMRFKFLEP